MTYYKAVRPDGTDFFSGKVRWLPTDGVILSDGWLVKHPDASTWHPRHGSNLSVSTAPADCVGMRWPCRLLEVEPSRHEVHEHGTTKRSALSWRVVGELPAWQALGPQGQEVAAIIERAGRLTEPEVEALAGARCVTRKVAWAAAWRARRKAARAVVAARGAAMLAARDAAMLAARGAGWDAAMLAGWLAAAGDAAVAAAVDAAGDAVMATLTRDIISDEHYQALMGPWLSVIGPVGGERP